MRMLMIEDDQEMAETIASGPRQARMATAAVKLTVSRLRAKLGEPPLSNTVLRSGYRIGAAS